MSVLYNYIKLQWIMRVYGPANMAICVTKNYITQAESDEIMAMPQMPLQEGVSADGS